MNSRIIYITDEGGLAVMTPTPEVLSKYSVLEVALKDVPAGKPFKIVNVSDIPADRTFRDAWEVNPADLTDGFGAPGHEFTR